VNGKNAQARPAPTVEERGGYPADPTPADVQAVVQNLPAGPAPGAATSNGAPTSTQNGESE
jgi:hypothetical protein